MESPSAGPLGTGRRWGEGGEEERRERVEEEGMPMPMGLGGEKGEREGGERREEGG